MILVLILITAAILGWVARTFIERTKNNDRYIGDLDATATACIAALALAVVLFLELTITIILLVAVVQATTLDDKIAMYSEANTALEGEIKASVERFIEHEKGAYEALAPNDAIAIATSYPTLSSSQLVQSQIQTYKDNKDQIAKLKERRVDAKITRWWLYFGN